MGLMSYIHRQLLRRGLLSDLLPDDADRENGDKPEREAARAEIEARLENEKQIRREVTAAIVRLRELNTQNHYGESLRRAFGGK